jgi:hypothetical protein
MGAETRHVFIFDFGFLILDLKARMPMAGPRRSNRKSKIRNRKWSRFRHDHDGGPAFGGKDLPGGPRGCT